MTDIHKCDECDLRFDASDDPVEVGEYTLHEACLEGVYLRMAPVGELPCVARAVTGAVEVVRARLEKAGIPTCLSSRGLSDKHDRPIFRVNVHPRHEERALAMIEDHHTVEGRSP